MSRIGKKSINIPDNVKANLKIIPVKWIDEVLEIALIEQPVPDLENVSISEASDTSSEDISKVKPH